MSHIAVKALKKDGTHTTKILQGDLTKEYMGRLQQTEYSGFGYGPSGSTFAGSTARLRARRSTYRP
jgi:hypothetical protein